MKRLLPVVLALLVGAAAGRYLWPRDPEPPARLTDIQTAFARAKAYYLNENNADYHRARLQLLPLGPILADSWVYHLDLALLDLQELNFLVQDRDRGLPDSEHARLLRSALKNLERARALDPGNEAVAYNLARTYRKLAPQAENDTELLEAALKLLTPLAEEDNPDPSTLLMLGELLLERNDYEGAHRAFRRIVDMGKDFVPRTLFYIARFKRTQALLRLDPEEALRLQRELDDEYRDKEKPKATAGAVERGRYTEFRELAEPPRTLPDTRQMEWVLVTERMGIPAVGDPAFFLAPDLDGDCLRDLVVNTPAGVRILRNRGNASFDDLTEVAGFPGGLVVAAAAAGDLDADGRCDLVLGGPGGLRLFLNRTPKDAPLHWRFEEVASTPDGQPLFGPRGLEPVRCLVLWDMDHDGDLDLFAGGDRNRAYRTAVEQPRGADPYLRFVEVSEATGLGGPPASDALLLDVDDDDDVDLLVTGPQGNVWFDNLREMRFEARPLPAGGRIEAADVDNDLLEEVALGGEVYRWADGAWKRVGARKALLDTDSDGVVDPDPFAGLALRGALLSAVATDLNRDDGGLGGRDLLVLTDRGLDLYLSMAGRPAAWIDLAPRGLHSNRLGIGAKVRVFARGFQVGATCRDGLVSVGLGRRTFVDAVMTRWTNGVEQGVVAVGLTDCFVIHEREGEVGSCPFVYAFDGERWHFIADCHSGTPLGLPVADRSYLPPRSSETILIPADRLRPADGLLRIDLAEELRELFYVDQVVLRALDHPAGVRPVLDEGFRVSRAPAFRVLGFGRLEPPAAARDHHGRDLLPQLRARDGRHAAVFESLDSRYPGLAREWAIELEFDAPPPGAPVYLVMDGWVEFPTASASIAASQTETVRFMPPVLEARGSGGEWTVVDPEPGFPAGKGKAVLVDLSGKLPPGRLALRLRSTLKLHWDAFALGVAPGGELRLTEVPLRRAEHRFRGMGVRIEDPTGELPWRYSHDELVRFHPWDQEPPGMLTPYGDVRPWLLEIDDRYPILASGDVVELAFDAADLPPLPEGWVRDWCFTTEGWVKDADLNQAVRERVGPLPFHGMSAYPYDETKERHPHPDFVERLTRPSRKLVDPTALR